MSWRNSQSQELSALAAKRPSPAQLRINEAKRYCDLVKSEVEQHAPVDEVDVTLIGEEDPREICYCVVLASSTSLESGCPSSIRIGSASRRIFYVQRCTLID
jgi:hypothetical protein